MENPFKVGDVIRWQWGFPEQDVWFYVIVKVTPKCVRLRRLAEYEHLPIPAEFADDNENGVLKRLKFYMDETPVINMGGAHDGVKYDGPKLKECVNQPGFKYYKAYR